MSVLHPRNLTQVPKIAISKGSYLFARPIILGFHLSFWECKWNYTYNPYKWPKKDGFEWFALIGAITHWCGPTLLESLIDEIIIYKSRIIHQAFQVPNMEVSSNLNKLYGCKAYGYGKAPPPKIVGYKVQHSPEPF